MSLEYLRNIKNGIEQRFPQKVFALHELEEMFLARTDAVSLTAALLEKPYHNANDPGFIHFSYGARLTALFTKGRPATYQTFFMEQLPVEIGGFADKQLEYRLRGFYETWTLLDTLDRDIELLSEEEILLPPPSIVDYNGKEMSQEDLTKRLRHAEFRFGDE